ncbi:MAG TPA: carboxypeptidase-like regulatory domain-containing protein, partial [Bryobacteraceae bacterium]|nr:carboxypeptidase-like regulatory domain-containing protein [Bryobacteraceae bacterium]
MSRSRLLVRSHWMAGLLALAVLTPELGRPAVRKTGIIEGYIRDQAGTGISGAQVRIENSPLGAVADSTGFYRLAKVPVGVVDLSAQFVGYIPVKVTGLKVLSKRITVQDFVLEQQAVDIGEISVMTATNALAPRDAVTTRQGTRPGEAA